VLAAALIAAGVLSASPQVFAADIINQTVTGHTSTFRGEYGGVVPYQENFVGNITGSTFTNNQVDTTGQVFPPIYDGDGQLSSVNPGGGAVGVENFTGNISNSIFRNNIVTTEMSNTIPGQILQPLGGALLVRSTFTGDITNTVFENNLMQGTSRNAPSGGATHVHNFVGTLSQSRFVNNKSVYTYDPTVGYASVSTVGGALSLWTFNGVIDDTEFSDNGFLEQGGAIRIAEGAAGEINNSRFVNNLGTLGGAIAVVVGPAVRTTNLSVDNNIFIGNTVSGRRLYNNQYHSQSLGGAVAMANSAGSKLFTNNVFLGNRAINESGLTAMNGWGGALAASTDGADQALTVAASTAGSGRTLFYGNVHNGDSSDPTATTPNAIHLANYNMANDRNVTATLDAAAGARILMLDPLSAQKDAHIRMDYEGNLYGVANLSTVVNKTGAGAWYLGGVNQMRGASTWNIGDGSLFLTTVDYGGTTGVQAAHVNLSHTGTADFTLAAGTTLAGSGSVTAQNITLNGTIAPEVWTNTGIKADAITTAITQAEIDGIEVAKNADFGELVFNGNVTLNGAAYDVDLNVDASQQDKLTVNGTLTVAAPSTVNVTSLTFTNPPVPDKDTDLYAITKVITTTGGISGADKLSVTAAGVNLTNADFLQAQGVANGNDYELALGLRWHSNRLDGAGLAEAHGDFSIAANNTFTINGDLAARTAAYSDANNASNWDGNSLSKQGDGTLVLNGNNTYSGGTDVQTGTLVIGDAATPGASISGDVTVAAGATLTGTGTITGNVDVSGWLRGTSTIIGSVTMQSGSTAAPGFSPGTLNVGDWTFASGSNYDVEINEAGQSDQIVAQTALGGGTITIDPGVTLNIINDGSPNPFVWNPSTQYDILLADTGISGQFDTVVNNLLFMDATLDYSDPLKVQLTMSKNSNPFAAICQTFNQCSTAGALEQLAPSHELAAAVASYVTTDESGRRAYDNLSGEIYASTRAALLANRRLREAVTTRTRQPATDEKLWASTWGVDGKHEGARGIATVGEQDIGLAVGGDVQLGNAGNVSVGAVLAYEDDRVKHRANRNAKSDVKAVSAGAYAAAEVGGVKVNAGALYSHLDMRTQRNIWIPTLQGEAKAKHNAHKVQVFAEVAKDVQVGRATVTPYAGVAQTWLKSEAARESAKGRANPARLSVAGKTDTVTQTTVGVRAAVQLPTTLPAAVYGDLGWQRTFGNTGNTTCNRFAGTDNRFTIRGTGVAKNTALIGAGVQAQLTPNASVTLGYQGEIVSKRKNHAAQLQVRVRF